MSAYIDWTLEDWLNAVYCETCGLPLLEVEDSEGVGHYECPFCTWEEDTLVEHNAKISELERTIQALREENKRLKAEE